MEECEQLHEGDRVRVYGQECVGELVKITDKYAFVVFKAIEARIPISQLERVQVATQITLSTVPIRVSTRVLNLSADEYSIFKPEIDLHGMLISEALSVLDLWIDKAFLLGHKYLKIIHGKGKGVLRNAVRAHLQSHGQAKLLVDRYSYPGGEGVTWLELT